MATEEQHHIRSAAAWAELISGNYIVRYDAETGQIVVHSCHDPLWSDSPACRGEQEDH